MSVPKSGVVSTLPLIDVFGLFRIRIPVYNREILHIHTIQLKSLNDSTLFVLMYMVYFLKSLKKSKFHGIISFGVALVRSLKLFLRISFEILPFSFDLSETLIFG